MSFVIATDTSANLPTPMIKNISAVVIPFNYYIDGVEYNCLDTEAFDGEGFYDMMRNKVDVTTSLVNSERYIEYLEPHLKEGKDILYIGMSSGISGSYNASVLAAQELSERYPERKIITIDTHGASLGEGMHVLNAAKYRDSGMSIEETADRVREECVKTCQVFTVDDLMFLKKGGRISGVVAVVGTVLNIKPLLKGNEIGQIVMGAKVRGRKTSITALAEEYERRVVNPKEQTVYIAHAGCNEDAELLMKLIKSKKPPKDFLNVVYEPVTGSHVGPGTLALFFMSDENVRTEALSAIK